MILAWVLLCSPLTDIINTLNGFISEKHSTDDGCPGLEKHIKIFASPLCRVLATSRVSWITLIIILTPSPRHQMSQMCYLGDNRSGRVSVKSQRRLVSATYTKVVKGEKRLENAYIRLSCQDLESISMNPRANPFICSQPQRPVWRCLVMSTHPSSKRFSGLCEARTPPIKIYTKQVQMTQLRADIHPI